MNLKKLKICLLLFTPFDQKRPSRPEVREIWGNYLPSFGHKITWITPSLEKGKKVRKILFKKDVKIYAISCPFSSSLPLNIFNFILYLFREFKLLNNILKKEKYDIIQVRNDIFGFFLAFLCRKSNIPIVFRNSFPPGAYKSNISKKSHLYYYGIFKSYSLINVLHKSDFVFPMSKWMEAKLIKEGIPKSKMMTVPMGVNRELFSLKKYGYKIQKKYDLHNKYIIIYVGVIDKLRQLDVIIRAFSKIRNYKDNVKLLLVGSGDDKSSLEKLSSTLGIQDDVIFTDEVPFYDIPYYISAADICLCPIPPISIYKVSSPAKILEYMAMSKPIVANEEIPEQKEIIEKSSAGVLVKFEDESFANGIMELLDNPKNAKEMGKKGHKWVSKNRSYDKIAHEIEKQYFKLLDIV